MPFGGCIKRGKEVRKEEVEGTVREILSEAEKMVKGRKIVLIYNGEKIGKLKMDIPLEELEVGKAWRSPFGIKVELEYQGRFVGTLMLKED